MTWPSTAMRPPSSRPCPSPAACCASAYPTTACPRTCCSARSTTSAPWASTCGSTSAAARLHRRRPLGRGLQGGVPGPRSARQRSRAGQGRRPRRLPARGRVPARAQPGRAAAGRRPRGGHRRRRRRLRRRPLGLAAHLDERQGARGHHRLSPHPRRDARHAGGDRGGPGRGRQVGVPGRARGGPRRGRQGARHEVPALPAGRARRGGRRQAEPIEGDFFEIACDTVIFAIGQAMVADFAKDG